MGICDLVSWGMVLELFSALKTQSSKSGIMSRDVATVGVPLPAAHSSKPVHDLTANFVQLLHITPFSQRTLG